MWLNTISHIKRISKNRKPALRSLISLSLLSRFSLGAEVESDGRNFQPSDASLEDLLAAEEGRVRRPKTVLVGHSLGCAGIARSFSRDPSGVAGIVLMAPAIMVDPFRHVAKLQSRKLVYALSLPLWPNLRGTEFALLPKVVLYDDYRLAGSL
jgi:alpha-beta hydrolase superfamily lysophospholipase